MKELLISRRSISYAHQEHQGVVLLQLYQGLVVDQGLARRPRLVGAKVESREGGQKCEREKMRKSTRGAKEALGSCQG
jgi:hypothetical protein